MIITSMQNPRIKDVVKLRERRARDKTGQFLIEGYRELLRAVQGGKKIDTVYYCPELFLGENEQKLIASTKGETIEVTPSVFQKISYRDRPDGLLAVAPIFSTSLHNLPKKKNPFYIVAEAIEKPGNLGSILRSSDAAGVDALLVCDKCTDLFNPNVVRSSVGTVFTVPIAEATTAETLHFLREQGVKILAATPEAKAVFTEVDMTGPIALVVGTEQLGLSKTWMDEADIQVRIPMRGIADSLNVAAATTLLLYEVVRQR